MECIHAVQRNHSLYGPGGQIGNWHAPSPFAVSPIIISIYFYWYCSRQAPTLIKQNILVSIDRWDSSSGHHQKLFYVRSKEANQDSLLPEFDDPHRRFGQVTLECLWIEGSFLQRTSQNSGTDDQENECSIYWPFPCYKWHTIFVELPRYRGCPPGALSLDTIVNITNSILPFIFNFPEAPKGGKFPFFDYTLYEPKTRSPPVQLLLLWYILAQIFYTLQVQKTSFDRTSWGSRDTILPYISLAADVCEIKSTIFSNLGSMTHSGISGWLGDMKKRNDEKA